MKEIALLRTHIYDETVKKHYAQLNEQTENCRILYDATDKEPLANAFNFTIDDYRNSGYPLATKQQIEETPTFHFFYNNHGKKAYKMMNWEIYYNPEYAVLQYYLQNPNFDYYWSIEYDVFFNGNWDYFFKKCRANNADMLGTYIRYYETNPPFEKIWKSFNFKVSKEQRKITYGCIIRYSNKALKTIHEGLLSGKHGFYEIIGTTLCNLKGLKIDDIGTCGYFYTPITFNSGHSKDLWTDEFMQKNQNILFHPIRVDNYE